MNQTDQLAAKHKKNLDSILENLLKYFVTPEGIELSEKIECLLAKHKQKTTVELPEITLQLSAKELQAWSFIKRELAKDRSPSVRGITRAVGLKSSRSGALIVQNLIRLGVLVRRNGKLVINLTKSIFEPLG